jgi:histidine triad (HIT) family protein
MADQPDFDSMTPEQIAEYQKQNCIFCKIIKGDIPSRKAYEDDKMISILDINPATKGHLLVMTKEHYPILPLIPFEIAAHMFRKTKGLVYALKQAIITNKTTVFIANGAIAGQQSPHFIYHLVPRDNNDGLDNFSVPARDYSDEEVSQFMAPLKARLEPMMREYNSKTGKIAIPEPAEANPKPTSPETIDSHELAKLIEENPKVKEMIVNDPEGFKKELENNPEMKKIFANINIIKLSAALNSIKKG